MIKSDRTLNIQVNVYKEKSGYWVDVNHDNQKNPGEELPAKNFGEVKKGFQNYIEKFPWAYPKGCGVFYQPVLRKRDELEKVRGQISSQLKAQIKELNKCLKNLDTKSEQYKIFSKLDEDLQNIEKAVGQLSDIQIVTSQELKKLSAFAMYMPGRNTLFLPKNWSLQHVIHEMQHYLNHHEFVDSQQYSQKRQVKCPSDGSVTIPARSDSSSNETNKSYSYKLDYKSPHQGNLINKNWKGEIIFNSLNYWNNKNMLLLDFVSGNFNELVSGNWGDMTTEEAKEVIADETRAFLSQARWLVFTLRDPFREADIQNLLSNDPEKSDSAKLKLKQAIDQVYPRSDLSDTMEFILLAYFGKGDIKHGTLLDAIEKKYIDFHGIEE
ncbi:MAG: hypothetical protein H7A32_05000 [Deltaproteobacteria bacterium]|nr:hypothetical protein [Deltaproteobacteria bacterium]